jgi:chaperonin GroES
MNIKPLNDRVLLKPLDVEDISAGGIVFAQSVTLKEPRLHAEVLDIGDGRQNASGKYIKTFTGKVGDIVVYGNVNSTVKEIIDGEKVLLIAGEAIVGIIS